jgi:hypothetical protein
MREESEAIEEANKLKQAGTKIIAVGKNFSEKVTSYRFPVTADVKYTQPCLT